MLKFLVNVKAAPVFPYYMQHRMDDQKLDEWEKNRGLIIENKDVNKKDSIRAEFSSLRD